MRVAQIIANRKARRHQTEEISAGVVNYLTKGLTKPQAAQFKAYWLMVSNGIELTPNQEAEYNRLKVIGQANRNK